jgi:hypothetical protein
VRNARRGRWTAGLSASPPGSSAPSSAARPSGKIIRLETPGPPTSLHAFSGQELRGVCCVGGDHGRLRALSPRLLMV